MKKRPRRQVSKAAGSSGPSSTKVGAYGKLRRALDRAAAAIVAEILDQMKLTLTGLNKSFTANALDEWTPKLKASVAMRLLNHGNWATDRANVLAVAGDMARIGALLSGGDSKVNKGRVHASFRACKDHATCPGNLGSGRWCDFDI